MNVFFDELDSLKNEKTMLFTAKLIPNIERENILGVSIPKLRFLAKKILKERQDDVVIFLRDLPHKYIEENTLHTFLIAEMKDINEVFALTDKFLPFIDNWAVCDSFLPKVFAKNLESLLPKITEWLQSEHVYTVRFAIGLLLKYFLTDSFKVEYLKIVSKIKTEEYYINMMIAWFFAEALVKQEQATFPFIQARVLSPWVHNKAIQKACESRRIDKDLKVKLKLLRVSFS